MVGGHGGVGLEGAGGLKAGHKAQQVDHVTRARHADEGAVQDGDGAGRVFQGLGNARHRDDGGHVRQIVRFRDVRDSGACQLRPHTGQA